MFVEYVSIERRATTHFLEGDPYELNCIYLPIKLLFLFSGQTKQYDTKNIRPRIVCRIIPYLLIIY